MLRHAKFIYAVRKELRNDDSVTVHDITVKIFGSKKYLDKP